MFLPRVAGFSVQKILGKGSYGTVYKVKRDSDDKSYAMKVVDLSMMNNQKMHDALNEIRILASIESPFIIAFHEATIVHSKLCIVTEYAKLGDLSKAIERRRAKGHPFSEKTIWCFLLQILEGLKIMHSQGIIHRDLKSANILISAPDLYKIGDLGISTVLAKRKLAKTQIGTPMYLAPEIWKNRPYDAKCDVWSLGIIIYEMMTLKYPFNGKTLQQLSARICSGRQPLYPSDYSSDLISLLKQMLNINPLFRPSVQDLINNPIVQSRISLLDNFMPSIEQSNAKLLETIVIPKNLSNIHLPKPRYSNEIIVPIEQRINLKGKLQKQNIQLEFASTKEIQFIADMDSWSPIKNKSDPVRIAPPPTPEIPEIVPQANPRSRNINRFRIEPPRESVPHIRARLRYRPPLIIR